LKFEKKKILITVKAYPNPSKKYSETVCCAGVDLSNSQLIRLYPITYRDLDEDKKFKKYSIIEVDCSDPSDDKRPESFHVNVDTIKVIDQLDTDKGTWERRKSIVLKVLVKSMCQVYKDAEHDDLSLGLIKPDGISFELAKQSLSDQKAREACYAQLSFIDEKKEAIEKIPFNFYYKFKCPTEADCPGHKLSIIDWEIMQAYRDWRSRYPTEKVLLEMIEQHWLDIADTTKKDVYFYVGNTKRFRDTFMVLGVFYPTKTK
jgi:hypothetical protein